jgi:arylsulfatase A-like enzyme
VEKPNVLLVAIDSARADRLSCYGYDRPTTPTIDAIAAQGVRFEAAYSESSWTVPVMFSLLTGLAPREHRGESLRILPPEMPSLLEALRGAGYTTYAGSANPFFGPKCGTHVGFDHFYRSARSMRLTKPFVKYIGQRLGWADNGGRAITTDFIRSLPRLRSPWFAILWYFDVHSPYAPREPFTSRFARRPMSLRDRNALLRRLRRPPELIATASEEDIERLNDLFDAALAYEDMLIGCITKALEDRGLWDETVAVITADHGEMLGERGLAGHGRSGDMYQPVVRVPLVVRAPGRPAEAEPSRALVQLADVTQTVASAAGVADSLANSAATRVDLLSSPGATGRQYAISEREPFNARSANAFQRRNPTVDVEPHLCHMTAVVRDGWKLIHRTDGRHELFDLAADPGEERNALEGQPGRARALTDIVLNWQETARPHPSVAGMSADEEAIVEKRLQDLGYF